MLNNVIICYIINEKVYYTSYVKILIKEINTLRGTIFNFIREKSHMKKLRPMIIAAVCVSLASQIDFDIFVPGFMISLAPIIFTLMLYINRDFNPITVSFFAGIMSPLYRGLIIYLSGTHDNVLEIIYADMLFYFAFGILFYFLYWNRPKTNITNFFAATVISDAFANMLEVSVMLRFTNIKYEIFQILIIIAFVRATISVCIILLLNYYKFLLRRQEHEERYRELVMITSNVKSEIYFMNKNNIHIENVMKKAYFLYKELSEEGYPVNLKETSLDVAKDVHEIKKDYINIIRGLEGQFNANTGNIQMNIKDLISIMNDDVKEFIRGNKLKIYVDFAIIDNFNVANHYYLLTVIRNLIYNSIEALENNKNGHIFVKIQNKNGDCIFTVSDNGIGIKERDIAYIFNPGFSTKFNKDTGDICRGIGMAHVKDIINEVFGGTIEVRSNAGVGTEITVKIDERRIVGVSQ
jgi:two-component system sensor histidine kinase YcbA